MTAFSRKTIKHLFALSGNVCAFPACLSPIVDSRTGVVTGDICHIRAKSPKGPRFDPNQSREERDSASNLILLCREHHRIVDTQPEHYPASALLEMKAAKEPYVARSQRPGDERLVKLLLDDHRRIELTNNSGNIAIDSPGAIQAHILNIKTGNSKVVVAPPPGTIGADQRASRYVRYLIERYNKFADDTSARKAGFHHGAVSRNIASRFGSEWRLLPIEKADELYQYLQERISRTRIARINKGEGRKSFSSYEEFAAKHQ